MVYLLGFIILVALAIGIYFLVRFLLIIARRVEEKDKETFEKRKN